MGQAFIDGRVGDDPWGRPTVGFGSWPNPVPCLGNYSYHMPGGSQLILISPAGLCPLYDELDIVSMV